MILVLTTGFADGAAARLAGKGVEVAALDQYDLGAGHLDGPCALVIGMHCDQRFLAARAGLIAGFLNRGGRVVASGHHAYPFLPGIGGYRSPDQPTLADLAIHRLADHPVWAGVEGPDLTFRRGVAGFYGRVWHQPPDGALVVNGIGRDRRPLDFVYPVGAGTVLFHGGNDLTGYGGADDSSGRILPQLRDWMMAR
jgi:hypothetical protein